MGYSRHEMEAAIGTSWNVIFALEWTIKKFEQILDADYDTWYNAEFLGDDDPCANWALCKVFKNITGATRYEAEKQCRACGQYFAQIPIGMEDVEACWLIQGPDDQATLDFLRALLVKERAKERTARLCADERTSYMG